eukprot:scaffold907_cov398-Prasinococcus_capsulatus_cf.AAC.8
MTASGSFPLYHYASGSGAHSSCTSPSMLSDYLEVRRVYPAVVIIVPQLDGGWVLPHSGGPLRISEGYATAIYTYIHTTYIYIARTDVRHRSSSRQRLIGGLQASRWARACYVACVHRRKNARKELNRNDSHAPILAKVTQPLRSATALSMAVGTPKPPLQRAASV